MKSPIARWHDGDKREIQVDLRAIISIVKTQTQSGGLALEVTFIGNGTTTYYSFQDSESRQEFVDRWVTIHKKRDLHGRRM
jgi:hypothetical protein